MAKSANEYFSNCRYCIVVSLTGGIEKRIDCVKNYTGTILLKCFGDGMKPILNDGSEGILSPAATIKIGDVILTINKNKEYVLVRLIDLSANNVLVCRGDNSPISEYIRFDQVYY